MNAIINKLTNVSHVASVAIIVVGLMFAARKFPKLQEWLSV